MSKPLGHVCSGSITKFIRIVAAGAAMGNCDRPRPQTQARCSGASAKVEIVKVEFERLIETGLDSAHSGDIHREQNAV